MALSVIGVGFGRTGTLSLKAALEKLGLGTCYHMMEVRHHSPHAKLWHTAAEGEPIDWERLFDGYGATVDWPSCYFWRELTTYYSDAKVILTVRNPERWYESVRNTIYQVMQERSDDPVTQERRDMAINIILERTFGGRFLDREHAIGVYEQHNRTVQNTVPVNRLLNFEVAQGWSPLCDFLGLSIPEEPFPRVNSTENFQEMMQLNSS